MPDNLHLVHLRSAGLAVHKTPVAFKGGNVLVDHVAGRQVAFCGSDTLRIARTAAHALTGIEPTEAEVAAVIGDTLNANELVVVKADALQPVHMYHLDQAMTLLHDRTAAVARVVGAMPEEAAAREAIEQVESFLTALRAELYRLGYAVVDVDTTVDNVLGYQHYVNLIPFVHRETGKRTLLMPVYRNAASAADRQVVERNTATLASLGYEVVHVPTSADDLTGGIHCLVNVLD